jgi:phosphonate transport system substrate-binding protein
VISGKVAAAAVDSQTFAEIPPETRQAMVILAKTESLPRQVVVVSPTMSPEQVEQVKQILINIDRDPQAESILEQFERTKKFDQLPSETSFERMQQIYQLVQQQ